MLHAAVRYCYGESDEKPASWSEAGHGISVCYERNSSRESERSGWNWSEGTVNKLVIKLVKELISSLILSEHEQGSFFVDSFFWVNFDLT